MNELPRKELGKVAALPKAIRDDLNLRLLNGATLQELCDFLNSNPAVQTVLAAKAWGEFNVENLSNWRQSGYATWLKSRQRFEDIRLKAEARAALRQQLAGEGLDLNDANATRLLEIADDLLDDFDPAALREAAKDKPLAALRWLTDLAAGTSEGKRKAADLDLKVRRYEEAAAKAKDKLTIVKREGGLSEEARRQIEEAVALL